MLDDAYHALEESFVIESYESSYATEGSCPPVRRASAPHIKGFCGHPTHQHPLVWESMTQNFEVAEGTLTKSRPSSRPSLPWHSPKTSSFHTCEEVDNGDEYLRDHNLMEEAYRDTSQTRFPVTPKSHPAQQPAQIESHTGVTGTFRSHPGMLTITSRDLPVTSEDTPRVTSRTPENMGNSGQQV